MFDSPLEHAPALSGELGVEIYVKRDDLLPFPVPGNKVRKLEYELASLGRVPDVVITTGGAGSNHCRTLAWFGALRRFRVCLVLHGEPGNSASERMLRALGADCTYVAPNEIATTIDRLAKSERLQGHDVHVVAGGCHTSAGVAAYQDAATAVIADLPGIDLVVVATGTGATQAGIVAGFARASPKTRVLGISVARGRARAEAAVREALSWSGNERLIVEVDDSYVDGGYARYSAETERVVNHAWLRGLPLDPVYTAKAFRGFIDACRVNNPPRTALFWHTGGLLNWIDEGEKASLGGEGMTPGATH